MEWLHTMFLTTRTKPQTTTHTLIDNICLKLEDIFARGTRKRSPSHSAQGQSGSEASLPRWTQCGT